MVEQIRDKNYKEMESIASLILQSSDKAMNLLSNLMVWAQSQSGKLQFNPEVFEIESLVLENTQLLAGIAEQKSIRIQSVITTKQQVYADIEMTSTIIRNLISNALKFTHINGEITISGELSNKMYIVNIIDQGVGIPPERINKLFHVAKNQSTLGTQNEEGTGLGLILCKEFIEKNNGQI